MPQVPRAHHRRESTRHPGRATDPAPGTTPDRATDPAPGTTPDRAADPAHGPTPDRSPGFAAGRTAVGVVRRATTRASCRATDRASDPAHGPTPGRAPDRSSAPPAAIETAFPRILLEAPEGITPPVPQDRRAEGADLSGRILSGPVAGVDDEIVVSPTPPGAPPIAPPIPHMVPPPVATPIAPPVAPPAAIETAFPPILREAPEGMTSPVPRDRRADGDDLSEMIRANPPDIPGGKALRLEDLFVHPSAVEGDRIPGWGG